MKLFLFIFAYLFLFNNVLAQETTIDTDLSPVFDISIKLAEERGLKIFRKDQFAWKASDILSSDPNRDFTGLKGWVTEDNGKLATTYFIGGEHPNYNIKYQVDFDENQTPIMVEPVTITNSLLNKFKARQTALSSIKQFCSNTYNSIILEEGNNIIVYWLAGTKVQGEIPVGGHFRFTYHKDNPDIYIKEKLSNSCLMLNPQKDVPEDATAVMSLVSHVVSKSPQDVHVFLSLLYGDIGVVSDDGLFSIKQGKIERIQETNE